MDLIKLEGEFLRHLAARQKCSAATVKTYRSAFRQAWRCTQMMGVELDTEALDYTWADLLVDWWCGEQKLGPRTVHRNVTALRSMFAFARKRRWTERDPFAHLDLPDKGAVERVHLTTDDQNALVRAAAHLPDPRFAAMARALVLTQLTVGTRVSELLDLKVSDLDLCQQVVHINHGKGDQEREVVLDDRATAALEVWLQVRRQWLDTRQESGRFRGGEPEAVWLADRGRRLSSQGVYALLDELTAGTPLAGKVRIHDLRHATAKRWFRDGVPLEQIQQRLGHSSRSTTEQYIRGASPNTRLWAERCGLPETAARGDSPHALGAPAAGDRPPVPTPAPKNSELPRPGRSFRPQHPLVAQHLQNLRERMLAHATGAHPLPFQPPLFPGLRPHRR